MKTWRLVSGIISCTFALYVLWMVSQLSKLLAMTHTQDTGVLGGLIVAGLLIATGAISIANRAGGKGSNIALLVLFAAAVFVSFTTSEIFQNLKLAGIWAGACGVVAIINFVGGYGEPE